MRFIVVLFLMFFITPCFCSDGGWNAPSEALLPVPYSKNKTDTRSLHSSQPRVSRKGRTPICSNRNDESNAFCEERNLGSIQSIQKRARETEVKLPLSSSKERNRPSSSKQRSTTHEKKLNHKKSSDSSLDRKHNRSRQHRPKSSQHEEKHGYVSSSQRSFDRYSNNKTVRKTPESKASSRQSLSKTKHRSQSINSRATSGYASSSKASSNRRSSQQELRKQSGELDRSKKNQYEKRKLEQIVRSSDSISIEPGPTQPRIEESVQDRLISDWCTAKTCCGDRPVGPQIAVGIVGIVFTGLMIWMAVEHTGWFFGVAGLAAAGGGVWLKFFKKRKGGGGGGGAGAGGGGGKSSGAVTQTQTVQPAVVNVVLGNQNCGQDVDLEEGGRRIKVKGKRSRDKSIDYKEIKQLIEKAKASNEDSDGSSISDVDSLKVEDETIEGLAGKKKRSKG